MRNVSQNKGRVRIDPARVLLGCSVLAAVGFSTSAKAAVTGSFTGPLTTGVLLSLDINGGIIASNNTTTEGSNGPSTARRFTQDPYGVTWTGWGGPTSTNGDGTQLPNSNGGGVTASSITKTAGGFTVTISEPGTAANYASSGTTLNGRDRGTPSGAAGDGDMFRDFEFVGGSGSNVQSTNFLQVLVSGLTPGKSYQLAGYSYDSSSTGNKEEWTAMPPSSNLSNGTHIGYNPDPADTFVAPSDEQTISFSTIPAPAIFTVTADANGTASLYTWGGDGITGDAGATSSYINAIQIGSAVPEPASVSLIGVGAISLLSRRKTRRI